MQRRKDSNFDDELILELDSFEGSHLHCQRTIERADCELSCRVDSAIEVLLNLATIIAAIICYIQFIIAWPSNSLRITTNQVKATLW